MNHAPLILVIDDELGRNLDDRRMECRRLGLQDVTGDDATPRQIDRPVARAVFESGQVLIDGGVSNSLLLATSAVQRGWSTASYERWALVLLDLRFVTTRLSEKDMEGLRRTAARRANSLKPEVEDRHEPDERFGICVLIEIRRRFPRLPVVVMSSTDRSEVIERCREEGAVDFIQKEMNEVAGPSLRDMLRQKLHQFGLLSDASGVLIGNSVPLLETLAAARRAATASGNTLLLGETGTGKELVAQYVHRQSAANNGPYVVFHPFGTASTLQEDELFGHVRGAFTGANDLRRGLFEQAQRGTLFIDEVGDLPLELQAQLLRPLESRSVSRQGSSEVISLRLQVVLATNKDLDLYSAAGRFKLDLLNRINAYTIRIPPLRERRDDIPLLARALLRLICEAHSARWPREFNPDAMAMLVAHDWTQGNVRELRNVLERVARDNPDTEVVVPSDIRLESFGQTEQCRTVQAAESRSYAASTAAVPASELEPSRVYGVGTHHETLAGAMPRLLGRCGERTVEHLEAALELTAIRDVNTGAVTEVNLAGAVGLLEGRRVSSVEAADLLKRWLALDAEVGMRFVEASNLGAMAWDRVNRIRPRTTLRRKQR